MDTRENLLTVFDIGPEDLTANQQGRLGPRQRQALRRQDIGRAGVRVAGAVLVAGGFAAAPVPLWTQLAVAVVAAAVAVVVMVHAAGQVRGAQRPGTVACLSGAVTPMLLFRENAGWWLAVQGRTLRVPVDVTHLDQDTVYHVYYLRRSHRVVAVEPVTVDVDRAAPAEAIQPTEAIHPAESVGSVESVGPTAVREVDSPGPGRTTGMVEALREEAATEDG